MEASAALPEDRFDPEVGGEAATSIPRVVVMGASAGGVQALSTIVAALPASFPAPILAVVHQAPGAESRLAPILDRAGSLPAETAEDGRALRAGEIVVAPPDRHLMVEDGRVRLVRGPRVNASRPSVDVLFRSAVESYGARVVGVVLSGSLQDGTLGLSAIKSAGGVAIVQSDPVHEGMPTSAAANVEVDYLVPLREIAG